MIMIEQQTRHDSRHLRHSLSKIALGIRRNRIQIGMLDKPFSAIDYEFYEGGKTYKRKKIILAARGCTAATCTMCPIPNEAYYNQNLNFTPNDFLRQFHSSFETEPIDSYQLISVYNSGNWFANKEIPPEARQGIYHAIANSRCEGIMVESLPQFITIKAIAEAKEHLGDKRLIVGIGLQSADDFIRNVCINTTCTKEQFEQASHLLWQNGYTAKAYLMIKPPFLTESEAVAETVQSIQYVSSIGYEDVSVCPTRIAPYTVVAELARQGMYTPPSLWTTIDILDEVRCDSLARARVACLDVDGKDGDTVYPRNCPLCTHSILDALKNFNMTRDLSIINSLDCWCRQKHITDLAFVDERPLADRVQAFLETYSLNQDSS
jgi:archaeosine synthase beta-subunit